MSHMKRRLQRKFGGSQKNFRHIETVPKHMSRSWPGPLSEGGNMSRSVKKGLLSILFRDRDKAYKDEGKCPKYFPFKKASKDETISIFSNYLILEDKFDSLTNIREMSMTKMGFKPGEGITTLPPTFCKLKNLKVLDLRCNPFEEFPQPIFELVELETLNLDGCNISYIPEKIKTLKNLKNLYLGNNQVKSPKHLSLPNLKHLYLGNNGIVDISGLCLKNLSMIDLSENFIEIIPEDFFHGAVVKRLDFRHNSLKKLPDSLCNITELRQLDVSKNLLFKLPENIGNLSKLKDFNISWNDLTVLPESIVKLPLRKKKFFCGENPLQRPPYEVAIEGQQAIASYYKMLNSGSSKIHNNRLKLMVLGNQMSGKTTLSKAIHLFVEPDTEEERTIGMDFFHWKAEAKEDGLQVLLVDCAGQKKYILTHQLFMSTGLLFLVVVNLKTYTNADYKEQIGDWIDLVLARVPKAVIIIVPTHIDLCSLEEVKEKCDNILQTVNTYMNDIRKEKENELHGSRSHLLNDELPFLPTNYMLQEDNDIRVYPPESNSVSTAEHGSRSQDTRVFMIPVSNKKQLHGLKLLREEIIRIAYNRKLCPSTHHILPESWVKLEEICMEEQKNKKTITKEELFEKSSHLFETEDDMLEAIKYIDSIGPILYFHSISSIRDIVFLDPRWLSAAFKLIFRHDFDKYFVYKEKYEKFYEFEEKFNEHKHALLETALLNPQFLRCLWYEDFKDEEYFNQVVALLKNFDLAIDVRLRSLSEEKNMLVPWFLKEESSYEKRLQSDNNFTEKITCYLKTKGVLPEGFFQRFIVKIYALNNLLDDLYPWQSGFIGLTKNHRIKCIYERKTNQSLVTVIGSSDRSNVYHLWDIIIPLFIVLKDFIKEWEGIRYKTFSVCPTCLNKDEPSKTWELDFETLQKREEEYCRVECKHVDPYLVHPPPTIMMKYLATDHERSRQIEEKLEREFTADEKDVISGVIGHRCEELRQILEIHEGNLDQIHAQTNWRERVLKVIKLWENKNENTSIKKFLECVHNMKPFPHDIAEICIKTPLSM